MTAVGFAQRSGMSNDDPLHSRVIGADPNREGDLARLVAPMLSVALRRWADEGITPPRGLVVVGHARVSHNDGEFTIGRGRFAWLWLADDLVGETLAWTVAHEIAHLVIAGATGFTDSAAVRGTAGERIAGEYAAEVLAGEILTEAAITRLQLAYDEATVDHVVSLWSYARRKAQILTCGDPGPTDQSRLEEAVRLLVRDFAYAAGRGVATGDVRALHLADWLSTRPGIDRLIAPLRGSATGSGASIRATAHEIRQIGAEIDALMASAPNRADLAQAIAA